MSSFIPKGVCSTKIDFEIDDEGLVHNVRFTDGCPGNSAALTLLTENRAATDLIKLLEGLPCDRKNTSCPDQLTKALSEELEARRTSIP